MEQINDKLADIAKNYHRIILSEARTGRLDECYDKKLKLINKIATLRKKYEVSNLSITVF